jgi:hypothetical protein
MTRTWRGVVGLVVTLLLCAPSRVAAQFDTATVVGTVRDPSGAAVAETKVTLTNTETAVSVVRTSNSEGNYEFVSVRPGVYVIAAEREGFSLALLENLRVEVGARVRADLKLEVGGLNEEIKVTADAKLIQTDDSQRSQVLSTVQIQQLPLNGRSYAALALLSTGVRRSSIAAGREGSFNVNGLRSTMNNFMLDGLDNNAYATSNQGGSNQMMQPPPDAVAEVKVITNNESAEYGHSAGATMNVAFRSGTNQLRGGAWEFFRNTALNSSTYFAPPGGQKATLEYSQFGGVLGGPIIKNRMFFFADYEGLRQKTGGVAFATIPTADQRRGIFGVDVRDPRSGAVYPAGTPLPMTAFARKVLGDLPDPTLPGSANNYAVQRFSNNPSNKGDGKVDFQATERLRLFGRYSWRNADGRNEAALPLPTGGGYGFNYTKSKQVALGATHVQSERAVLEVRLGWSTVRGWAGPGSLGTESALDAYGIAGLPDDPRVAGGLPSQLIAGYTSFGRATASPQWQFPSTWNPKVNYTWLRGRQSLKVGYEFIHMTQEVQDINPLYGSNTFAGQFTRPVGAAPNNLYNISDFMFGLRSQYDLSNVVIANLRRDMHFPYVQDDIRINDQLTINVGLRYEYVTPFRERDNNASNFDPTTRSMVRATDDDPYLVDPDRNNFGPRLGFAYTPFAKTAIRGGYGISYTHFNRTGSADVLTYNPPQTIVSVTAQTPADPFFLPAEAGYPAGLTDPSRFNPKLTNVLYQPRDFQSARTQSWFVSYAREFGPGMLLDVAYVGNKSNDLAMIANFNQAAPNDAAGTIPLSQRARPIPEYGDITYLFNGGKAEYHGIQTKYEWRMGSAVRLLNSLSLSRARDNSSQSLEFASGASPAPQDINNLESEWALSGYHQPYNNTTSLIVALPFGRGRRWGNSLSPALDALVGGWQLSGVNTITPGEQVNFTYTPSATFIVSSVRDTWRGANNYRPNVTCDPMAPKGERSINNWFNKSCVSIPTDPSQPFGNAARNSVRGPGFWTFDLAAVKQVPVSGARIELRLEAFNLFNRVNFLAPNANRSLPTFGTITGTYPPRQIQLGAKVSW